LRINYSVPSSTLGKEEKRAGLLRVGATNKTTCRSSTCCEQRTRLRL